jgi:hypothetical protein
MGAADRAKQGNNDVENEDCCYGVDEQLDSDIAAERCSHRT